MLVLNLTGCAPSYKIGGESFGSSSEALQKLTEINTGMLAQITESKNPIGGSALVAIPSDNEIRKNYMTATPRTSQEGVDYIIAAVRSNAHFIADAIIKRHLFNSVTIARHNGNPANFPIGNNDFLVYSDIDGWFIKGNNKSTSLPILLDKNKKLTGVQRTEAFLDDLYKQAKTLQGK